MRLMAVDNGPISDDRLMCVGDLHQSRLADENSRWAGQIEAKARDGVERATASRLLIIAEQDMDRPRQARFLKLRNHRKAERIEAFHVAGAAAEQAAILAPQPERIAGPALALDGHHVGVAGQQDAAVGLRADGQEKRGLVADRIEDSDVIDAALLE